MRSTLSFLVALIGTNLKASFALRGAFWLQLGFMILNNLIWFTTWLIFFAHFDSIRGWRLGDMAAIYGIAAASFGCSTAWGYGASMLSQDIVDGTLDSYLTLPRPVVIQAAASRSRSSGWGDLISGLALLAFSGHVHWMDAPTVLFLVACGSVVIVSSAIVIHSLAFWLGDVYQLARQFTEFLVTFSIYPEAIYGGWLKVLLYTAVPAGLIGFLPASALRDFAWWKIGAVGGGTAVVAAVALMVFQRGLRRYASGNRLVVRA